MKINYFKSVKEIATYYSREMIRQRCELAILQFYLHCMEIRFGWLAKGENHITWMGTTAKSEADRCLELGRDHSRLFGILVED